MIEASNALATSFCMSLAVMRQAYTWACPGRAPLRDESSTCARRLVAAGEDGDYRMVIEQRYQHMAVYRRWTIIGFRAWAVVACIRTASAVAAQVAAPSRTDWLHSALFGIGFALSVLSWLVSGFGSRKERFPLIMVFNACLFTTASMVRFNCLQFLLAPTRQVPVRVRASAACSPVARTPGRPIF